MHPATSIGKKIISCCCILSYLLLKRWNETTSHFSHSLGWPEIFNFIDKQCSQIYLYLFKLRDTCLSQTSGCWCEQQVGPSFTFIVHQLFRSRIVFVPGCHVEFNGLDSSCGIALEQEKIFLRATVCMWICTSADLCGCSVFLQCCFPWGGAETVNSNPFTETQTRTYH